ncbi:MAG: sulfite exporter TauE/SafE family protein [Thermoleophilia bacterium]
MELLAFGLVGLAAGLLGSPVGLGGGILIVPFLSLLVGVPIHEAVAASLVAVVATSSSSTVGFLSRGLVNLRLGLTLETTMTLGAALGGFASVAFDQEALSAIFAVVLGVMALSLSWRIERPGSEDASASAGGAPPGRLSGRFFDEYLGNHVSYSVARVPAGLATSLVAGWLSSLLGIGGGVVNVPTMTMLMGVPMKAAAATSSFMIGLTAVAGATVYYLHDLLDPAVASPVALGALLGAAGGARLASRLSGTVLRRVLSVVLILLAVQMALAAFGVRLR